MKRTFFAVLALFLLLSSDLAVVGCGQRKTQSAPARTQQATCIVCGKPSVFYCTVRKAHYCATHASVSSGGRYICR